MRVRPDAEPGRSATWAYRAASWTPILALFAVLAAVRLDAADAVVTTLLVIGLIALVVDAVVFVRALDRHT